MNIKEFAAMSIIIGNDHCVLKQWKWILKHKDAGSK
jgi:hypothetical protein